MVQGNMVYVIFRRNNWFYNRYYIITRRNFCTLRVSTAPRLGLRPQTPSHFVRLSLISMRRLIWLVKCVIVSPSIFKGYPWKPSKIISISDGNTRLRLFNINIFFTMKLNTKFEFFNLWTETSLRDAGFLESQNVKN